MTCPQFKQILSEAVMGCPHAEDKYKCLGRVHRICETAGHMPRGFYGAKRLEDIELVIVTAEPGDPAADESYFGDADSRVRQHAMFFERLQKSTKPFHEGLKKLLGYCWRDELAPDAQRNHLDAQWERTWYTNTVLCSANTSGGTIRKACVLTCGDYYLRRQLNLVPNAFVIALGHKARRRITWLENSEPFEALGRASTRIGAEAIHPSARVSSERKCQSWRKAAEKFMKRPRLK